MADPRGGQRGVRRLTGRKPLEERRSQGPARTRDLRVHRERAKRPPNSAPGPMAMESEVAHVEVLTECSTAAQSTGWPPAGASGTAVLSEIRHTGHCV